MFHASSCRRASRNEQESAFWCVPAGGDGGAHGLERIRPTGTEAKIGTGQKKGTVPKLQRSRPAVQNFQSLQ